VSDCWSGIVEIFSGSLQSDKCYYSKAVYEIIILFGRPIQCCTVQAEIVISLTACYLKIKFSLCYF